MRALIQRVKSAEVRTGDELLGKIGPGLLVFLACGEGDDDPTLAWTVKKIAALRIFEDEHGRMHRSVRDTGGGLLVVSQFTLYGDIRRGSRPSFTKAMAPELAAPMIQRACDEWRAMGLDVQQGRFGADMAVSLINDGPVTIWLEKEPEPTDKKT